MKSDQLKTERTNFAPPIGQDEVGVHIFLAELFRNGQTNTAVFIIDISFNGIR